MSTKTEKRLEKIGKAKYKVAKGHHDVRNWSVLAANGDNVGKVVDMVIDKETERVRYLELLVNARYPEVEDRHILVPTGLATIHPENQVVALRNIDDRKIRQYPAYNGEDVSREYEYKLKDYLATPSSSPENMQVDVLSPSREEAIRAEERENAEMEKNETIESIRAQRDQAVQERDRAIEERDWLRKELEEIRSKYEEEDNFYRHPFFDQDRPDERI